MTEEGSTLGLQRYQYQIILIMTVPVGPTFPLKLYKNQATILPLYVTFKCQVQ